ncbi:MAG: hypothetical protein GOVbin630_142 [Prokaryotic dsDNA virus sp.]|nr:MAG: hypothetical protein GOVbin630_142 [Prokaryotic dsDNA virus sp.]|tara:strand:- start:6941 stop:7144 length:204 start_codon:yes stop_codon:yes gene_type:complete
MENVISLYEERIKKAIHEATDSLIRARTLVSEGKEVPEDLIPRLEAVIANLEKQLLDYIENGNSKGD